MHIMQLISGTGAMNGAMVHCVQLCERLAERGHRITLVCRPGSAILEFVQNMPIEIVESKQHRLPTDELRRVAGIIRERGVDCMHTHMSRSQFFGVLLKQMTSVPCVATAHCQAMKPHRMFNDFVISNSQANRKTQMRKNLVLPSRIETVYCPVVLNGHAPLSSSERAEVRKSLGCHDDAPLIGLVGNVCPRKGHDVLIRALPQLLEKHAGLRVAVVGNEFEQFSRKFRKLADELRVTASIDWSGFRTDIPSVMSALDLCVVPSRAEPFGLTAVESLAVGTPVIASRVGGLPETVEHEQTGLLVPAGRPRALAEAIDRMLSDTDLRTRCSAAGRAAMLQRYAPEPLWNRIEEILVTVASGQRVSRAA